VSLEVEPGTAVILVGPNNSGKSLALREIENWCFGQDTTRKVIDSIQVDFPVDAETAEKLLRELETTPPANQGTIPGHFWIGQHTFRQDAPVRQFQISTDSLATVIQSPNNPSLRAWLSASYTVRLDGRTRFTLADSKPTGDLQQHPQNHLWALFKNDAARERVRGLTEDAFGLHFVIDPTGMHEFRIRMSLRAPLSKNEEQALDESARRFHSEAVPINELSDGVQAFVGLVSAVLSLPHKIILIDEPEAFLHPPLARRLGSSLGQMSRERDASMMVATHSAEFLLGCVETVETSIVRLTYENGIATARALSALELAAITKDPLLRATDVLDALFHRAAVIGEADSDRAFYNEINRRLVSNQRGIPDAIFLNAQNKGTIRRLVAPLRRLGIAAAAIVDLDLIEHASEFSALVDACQVPAPEKSLLEVERTHVAGKFAALSGTGGSRPIKVQGIAALGDADGVRATALVDRLAEFGLFLVPVGEAECWLRHIAASGHGSDWLVDMFSRIGQSDNDPNYVGPSSGDVWDFLDNIGAWVNNPGRLGTQ
jgi:ABC-type lipoprotein export system ATPase subunit